MRVSAVPPVPPARPADPLSHENPGLNPATPQMALWNVKSERFAKSSIELMPAIARNLEGMQDMLGFEFRMKDAMNAFAKGLQAYAQSQGMTEHVLANFVTDKLVRAYDVLARVSAGGWKITAELAKQQMTVDGISDNPVLGYSTKKLDPDGPHQDTVSIRNPNAQPA